MRGRRQERYCWQCKVFWDRRVAASEITQEDTHIPDQPDQTLFLEKWHEWHRGWRLADRDGAEERRTLLGESLSEVDIGCLPRSVQDLRNGLERSSEEVLLDQHLNAEYRTLHMQAQTQLSNAHESQVFIPEDERLFEDDRGDPTGQPTEPRQPTLAEPTNAPTVVPETSAESLEHGTAVRNADMGDFLVDTIHRHRNGVAPLGPIVPDERLAHISDDQIYLVIHELHGQLRARQLESTASSRPEWPFVPTDPRTISSMSLQRINQHVRFHEEELRRYKRRQAALAPLGTREEVDDPSYISPLANMFENFAVHYRQRQEALRRAQALASEQPRQVEARQHRPNQTNRMTTEEENAEATRASNLAAMMGSAQSNDNLHAQPSDSSRARPSPHSDLQSNTTNAGIGTLNEHSSNPEIQDYHQLLMSRHAEFGDAGEWVAEEQDNRPEGSEHAPSLDRPDDNRPPPVSEQEMMVKMECKICFTQVARVAVLPCGHCVMCDWCQKSFMPSHNQDATVPRDRDRSCPVCRKKVRRLAKIWGPEQVHKKERS